MMKSDRRGASMVLVIAALLAAGFIGVMILKMGTADKSTGLYYSQSESARAAAKAGLANGILKFTGATTAQKNDIMTKINNYRKALVPADVWILGTASTWEPLAANQKYKVRMTAFVYDNSTRTAEVTLISDGVELVNNRIKARSSAVGTYKLENLGLATVVDWGDQNALHLEDGLTLDIRGPIEVFGNTRFSSGVDFDQQTSGSVFHGRFSSQDDASGNTMVFKGKFTFEKNAYFGTPPEVQVMNTADASGTVDGYLKLEGKSGFPNGAMVTGAAAAGCISSIQMTKDTSDSYWIGVPMKRGWGLKEYYYLNDNDYYSNSTIFTTAAAIDPGTPVIANPALTNASIKAALSMQPPCTYTVNLGVIPDANRVKINTHVSSITGKDLEEYAANNISKRWNGFTVLELNNQMDLAATDANDPTGTPVTSKFIIIVRSGAILQPVSTGQAPSVYVNTSDLKSSGHITVISSGSVMNFGGWSQFRGLLYSTAGNFQIGGSMNTVENFYGSFYAKTGSSLVWYPKTPSANGFCIFDKTVFEELDVEGDEDPASTSTPKNKKLLTRNCGGTAPTSTSTNLVVTKSRMAATLLSRSM